MKNTIIVLGILVVCALIVFGMNVHYNNKEIELRELAETQKKNIENIFDNMWKILSQKAQVSDQYKEAFKEIYPKLIEGRYSSGDGSLMKWIQESNPNFDVSLYKDLMKSIEVERTHFTKEQTKVLDIIREHKVLCRKIPGSWFISDQSDIEYTVISSTRSKQVMESGVDDEVDLFKK